MSLRSPRERLLQALAYEAGGLALSVPLVALWAGHDAGDSLLVMLAMSGAVLVWSPVFNTLFDLAEWRLARRRASDRPQRWRLVHALGHEVSTTLVTLPILVFPGGLGWVDALLLDLGLTAVYAGYAYVFHLIYDRLWPVRVAGVLPLLLLVAVAG